MISMKQRILGLAMTGLLVAPWGCLDPRGSVPTSTEEATVKGTVIIKGKPATKGIVMFDPSNYKRKDAALRTTPLKNDGTYEIKTLVGLNTVKVTGPAAEQAGSAYVNMQYDVPAVGGTFNIELPPK
jgi:hypothetical protein